MGTDQVEENSTNGNIHLKYGELLCNPAPADAVVITGASGVFPSSRNVEELKSNLYGKVVMITPTTARWADGADHPELPKQCGLMPRTTEFDPGQFGLHWRLTENSDPLGRLILEITFETLIDAGLNPADLENTKTGVIFCSCFGDSEPWIRRKREQGFAFEGLFKSTGAAKVAYFLKTKGSAVVVDSACSSSLSGVEIAFNLMRSGECDACLVIGGNLLLRRETTVQFARLGVLSVDAKCKTFDEKANGYARSETINCILLQKAKDAKRIYAQIVNTKLNCDGYKEQGITYPSGQDQKQLLKEVYAEAKVDPNSLTFMEAHGTGTKVGDPEECNALANLLCKNRKGPLFIGSIKSNLGHSEPPSGLNSIIKAVLACETNLIPPNVNFTTPNPAIPSIIDGRMKVVTEPTELPVETALIGINSFGFGGANGHTLLRRISKKKVNRGIPDDDLPRLVFVSGRTEEAIHHLLDTLVNAPLDAEYIRLLHNIYRKYIANHLFRGYSIVSKQGELLRSMDEIRSLKVSPLFLIFGEVDNWECILREFSSIQIFSDALQKVDRCLATQKLSLKDTVLNPKNDRKKFNILGSLIVEICLADVLRTLGLRPANSLGYSYGELTIAYYEETLNLEEVIKCALILNTELTGVSSDQMNGYASSQNSSAKSSKLSSANRENLAKKLSTVLNTPRLSKNGSTKNKITSAECFADAILDKNAKICEAIKDGSILLEIGITGFDETTSDLEDVKRFSFQNLLEFLKSLGSIYLSGHISSIDKLYPEIEFPVKRGTPMIASKIKWKHTRNWWVYDQYLLGTCSSKCFHILTSLPTYEYVLGHVIDGRNLFPAAGYLVLVWNTINIGCKVNERTVITFKNLRFLRATSLSSAGVDLDVLVNNTGVFVVLEGNSIVVTGVATETLNEDEREPLEEYQPITSDKMNQKDIYKDLRLRGYDYKNKFRSLLEADPNSNRAVIRFDYNWVTFIDNMFQLKILSKDSRQLYVPTSIEYIKIDRQQHTNYFVKHQLKNGECNFPAFYDEATDTIRAGGVEVKGVFTSPIQRKKNLGVPVLEKYEFIPNNCELSYMDSIRVNTQILLENTLLQNIKSVELVDCETPNDPKVLSEMIVEALGDQPLIRPNAKILSSLQLETSLTVEAKTLADETDCILVIASKLTKRPQVLLEASRAIKDNGYIISRENTDFNPKTFNGNELTIVTIYQNPNETLVLLKKLEKLKPQTYIEIQEDPEFSWLSRVQLEMAKTNNEVIVYSQNNVTSGLLGFTNCLKREPGCQHIRCVLMLDQSQKFDPKAELYANQLKKNLTVNVYKNGQWGTFRHMVIRQNEENIHEHYFAKIGVRGDLSSFEWHEGPLKRINVNVEGNQKMCDIYYSSLNFRDIMTVTGKISTDACSIDRLTDIVEGFEFSGKDENGKRVMGLVSNGALANKVLTDDLLVFPVPDSWSLREASTVVCVYSTVIYAFETRGNMRKGDSVLIHSGTGGVGQAAIYYALHYGCTVFTTCGSEEKREFLKKKFPQLTDRHIGNSRDTSFERMVMRGTNGRGVDLVLNSLAEEKLIASVRCLARGGRFLEIGKFDFSNNNLLQLLLLEKEASFHGIVLDMFFKSSPKQQLHLQEIFQKAVADGAVEPLDATVFQATEIEQAFRYMASGKHMGKVVIEIQPEDAPPAPLKSRPRYYCDPNKSYIILGGLGGFGLELADWLIARGAKYLLLTSRSGIKNGYQKKRILLWRNYGVTVEISTADVTTREGCQRLIEHGGKLVPIGGIFNLAVVLQDAIFENQTVDMYKTSLSPKAYATKYLDEITRESCPELEDFVVFSSVSCGRGNAGQTNYGMANSVMERICEQRKKDGLPAVAIQWGAIGEVGLVAEMQEDHRELEIGGTLQQKLSSCLEVMDVFLKQNSPVVSSIVVAEKKNAGNAENVSAAIANILGIELKSVQGSSTLAEMGMDSMTAIEIKQVFEREYGIFLTAKDIRGLTFNRIKELQNEKNITEELTENDESDDIILGQAIKLVPEADEVEQVTLDLKSCISRNQQAPTVLFLPGVEGNTNIMKSLANKLKAHVVGVNYNYKHPTQTVSEMANTEINYVETNLKKNQPVYLVAHSYGTCIAAEAANVLEKKGYNCTVICIDASPAVIKLITDRMPPNEHEFDADVLIRCISFGMNREVSTKCKEELLKLPTLEEKLSTAVETVNSQAELDPVILKEFLTAVVYRLRAVKRCPIPNYSLKGRIILCKAGQQTYGKSIPNDLLLEQVCGRPVEILEFEGNHATVIENDKLADTINSLLM